MQIVRAGKKFLWLMALTTLMAPIADADEAGSGAYIGLGFGGTAYVDSNFVEEQQSAEDELGSSDSGFKIYGGYQFNQIIGLEASYTDYGEFTAGDYIHASQSVNISANLGYSFLDGQLRPFSLLGFGYLKNSFPHRDNTSSIDEDDFAFHLGLGLDYIPKGLGGIGFRLAYEGNSFSYDVDSNVSTKDDTYRQAFGILYLGVHYKF